MTRSRLLIVLAAVVALVAGALVVLYVIPPGKGTPKQPASLAELKPAAKPSLAPNVSFTDMGGRSYALSKYRGRYVLLNLYPYNPGHMMVVPYAHTADLSALSPEQSSELMALTQRCVAVLSEALRPAGFNIGMNLGRVAGAGIDQHLHMHIVPRWNGDMNFMPVIGGTKLIPEALDDTYAALKPLFDGDGAVRE